MKSEHQFPGLDHLRALAISLVFIYHYQFFRHPAWIEGFSPIGWTGVDLFFVLSGFLISNQLFAEWQKNRKISLSVFYIKRAFRILPPYLFILLIYLFVPAFHERERLAPLWKMLTFTQNYGQDIRQYGTFSHAWSLCVEEQFYLFLPLLLIALFYSGLSKKSAWFVPSIFLLTMVLRWLTWQFRLIPIKDSDYFGLFWYQWIYYPTFTRLDGLVTGVAIAAVYRFRTHWLNPLKKYTNRILLLGCLLFLACFYLCREQESFFATVFGFSLVAICFGFVTLSSVLPGGILSTFKSFITRNLATLSYSLYLSHKGIIHLTQSWLKNSGVPLDSGWMLLICIIACTSAALLMRIFIEKPFLKLRNLALGIQTAPVKINDIPGTAGKSNSRRIKW